MTTAEWGIIIGAIGVLITLVTLLIRLTNTLTKLTVTIDGLGEKVTDINCENKKQHDDLWGKSREHDAKLATHDTRIAVLEEIQPPRPRRKTAGV